MPLQDFPCHDNIQYLPAAEDEEPILFVQRPQFYACPTPPQELQRWLVNGWANHRSEPSTFQQLPIPGETGEESAYELFDSSTKRLAVYNKWLEKRRIWAEERIRAESVQASFEKLYELYVLIEKEAGQLELLVGDGLLNWRIPTGGIHHPLLLKRVVLKFNDRLPAFMLYNSDRPVELYSSLLLAIDGVDLKLVQKRSEELEAAQYHPLSEEDTGTYLKALVQSLSPTEGNFLDMPGVSERAFPRVWREPYLFARKRNTSYGLSVEQILKHLDNATEFSQPLAAIVGAHGKLGQERKGENGEFAFNDGFREDDESSVLLAKPANKAQIRIIKRLEKTGRVHVQGPPGTGKTHTIGNIIGHLLAQGKSILVTSHTEKALRVLKNQIPRSLQSLCVSVLSADAESRRQMENAVNAINSRLTLDDPEKLFSQADKLWHQRDLLLKDMNTLRATLRCILDSEYNPIEIDGKTMSPSEAARFVAVKKEGNNWIPGMAELNDPYPISNADLLWLYSSNALLDPMTESAIENGVLDVTNFPAPESFKFLVEEYRELLIIDLEKHREYWNGVNSYQSLETASERLFVEFVESRLKNAWRPLVIIAGKNGGQSRQLWEVLCQRVLEAVDVANELALLKHLEPQIMQTATVENVGMICRQIETHLKDGGNLSMMTLLVKREWKRIIQNCRVSAGTPSRIEHFHSLRLEAELQLGRQKLSHLWNQLIAANGGDSFESFGDTPELYCHAIVPEINRCLDWYDGIWNPLVRKLIDEGLNWELLEQRASRIDSPLAEYLQIEEIVTKRLPEIVASELQRLKMQNIEMELKRLICLIDQNKNGLPKQLEAIIHTKDVEGYNRIYNRLIELKEFIPIYEKRTALLDQIESANSQWAATIRCRVAPHDGAAVPGNLEEAWKWLRLASELKRRQSTDLAQVQKSLEAIQNNIMHVTEELVDKLAWANQIKLVRARPQLQQSLSGWLDFQKRLGSTRIKSIQNKMKVAAQRELANCTEAVPVWIMSLQDVAEKFNPASVQFDVVIIDEASQANLMALIPLYMAKDAIIVGDHEQTTPDPVGVEQEPIQNLIDIHLQGIPNAELFDLLTSVYDLARRSFGETILLNEHFRCVPEIIGFSNSLSYDNQIRPLRETSSSLLKPATVAYRVNGTVHKKRNEVEAEAIVRLIVAMTHHPSYSDADIGVISMLGEDQTKIIDSKLRAELSASEYIKRRIVCGSPAQFQGDERDVILISMVDSIGEEEDGFLRKKGEGAYSSNKKRFNVAASRAKNQLWVVHSIDPQTQLKQGDIRRELILYAQNPYSRIQGIINERAIAESLFEIQVMERLAQQGYRVKAQWPVGYYRIDLVVVGSKERLAIECDGDRFHGPEKRDEDLERQAVLERLGWKFARIRGSLFFCDPVVAMQPVFEKLEEMRIEKLGPESDDTKAIDKTLVSELEKIAWPMRVAPEFRKEMKTAETHAVAEEDISLNRVSLDQKRDNEQIQDSDDKAVFPSSKVKITSEGATNPSKPESVATKLLVAEGVAVQQNQSTSILSTKKNTDKVEEKLAREQKTDVKVPAKHIVSVAKTGNSEEHMVTSSELSDLNLKFANDPIQFVKAVPKEVWFRLSKWTKLHEYYQGWERVILYNIGKYQEAVTEKQAQHGRRMILESVEKGFE
ncbi:MAG: AAA domain-containing protein [Negativicutes bacterium]